MGEVRLTRPTYSARMICSAIVIEINNDQRIAY
jgi:hypothetical protein